MNVAVSGLAKAELAQYIRQHYPMLRIVKTKPEFVLCYGGDGTLLYSEREFPGVPKVMIRNSRVCNHCAQITREAVLKLLVQGKFNLVEHKLLVAEVNGKKLFALNDVIVGHEILNTGLRFTVYLNDVQYGNEYLGDGVIVATPLGSTGYYQSVTHSTFQAGLGVAFNNTVNSIGHLVVAENMIVKVKLHREPALVMVDNDRRAIRLKPLQTVTIQQSKRSTQLVYFAGKKYRQFNLGIGENRVPLGYCQTCSKRLPTSPAGRRFTK